MDKWIEALASGNFEAILALLTTLLSGGFGTALVFVATKFLNYKKSVKEAIAEAQAKLMPQAEKLANTIKKEIIDEMRADFKVIAESIALSTVDKEKTRLDVLENVSKIGVSKEVKEEVVKVVEEETKTKEEKKKVINKAVEKLENNTLLTL